MPSERGSHLSFRASEASRGIAQLPFLSTALSERRTIPRLRACSARAPLGMTRPSFRASVASRGISVSPTTAACSHSELRRSAGRLLPQRVSTRRRGGWRSRGSDTPRQPLPHRVFHAEPRRSAARGTTSATISARRRGDRNENLNGLPDERLSQRTDLGSATSKTLEWMKRDVRRRTDPRELGPARAARWSSSSPRLRPPPRLRVETRCGSGQRGVSFFAWKSVAGRTRPGVRLRSE
jgi:hypothetical protein